MFDALIAFLDRSADSLWKALQHLLWPALFFFWLGMLVKGRQLFADMRRATPEAILNVKIMAFNDVLILPLIAVLLQFLTELVQRHGLYLVRAEIWESVHPLLVIFIAIFIGDFVGYWRHRLEHSQVFWPSHAVHHSDTEMTWLALERFHPINRLTTVLIDSLALTVMGFPVEALIINNLVRHYYGYLIHADLPWTLGPLGRIFVSPAMHRWHHAADPRAFDTNYATVFSVFDQAFGTYRVPGICDAPLGVTDKMQSTLRSQMGYAFTARAYRRLIRRLKGDK